ncbi:MAG: efflux RND transporter periplasmic adaptor subunit [Planctomycetes bacterium]|nr:efflux RND transporter periplasmic adaptor subunit [Planctomycetota bacterium]
MRTLWIVIALAVLAPLPLGCSKRKAPRPSLGEVERLPSVETVVLGKPSRLEVIRSYTATIDAFEKAEVCAMVKGYLKEVPLHLDIGHTLKKGEHLLKLDVPDLRAERENKEALVEQSQKAEALTVQAIAVAQAEIKEAQALVLRAEGDVEFRKAQHVRVRKLAQGDTLSQQQVEEAKLQLAAAQAALFAAQAQVVTKQNRKQAALKEQQLAAARVKTARTELERASVQLEFAELRAPFNGIITKRWLDSGATVKDAGVPLFTIMRTDFVRVILDVPERDVVFFRTGPKANKVELQIPALKNLGKPVSIEGSITLLSSAIDSVTRTMRAEIHLDNKLGLLRPQMTGTARVTLAVREAYTVPASALVRAGTKTEIYVVADATGEPLRGTVKRIEVQIGVDDGRRVEIRNDALTGRELVIAKGAGALRPGDQVISVPAGVAE